VAQMITVPYLLIVWTMNHGTLQTEYSNKTACENARNVLIMAAVEKDGKTRKDLKAVCVTARVID